MTFHVRLVSLPDRTDGLVDALAADAGVSNLLVLRGTAHRLGGDGVQFDVRPRSANAVFRLLESCHDDLVGTVAVDYVDATLGERAAIASKHFLVQRDVAPAWEVVEARIRSDAVYAPSFYVLLAITGAAADIALSLAYASWSQARGAAFQLLLNVTVLIPMGALVLRVQRIIWSARERTEPAPAAPGAG